MIHFIKESFLRLGLSFPVFTHKEQVFAFWRQQVFQVPLYLQITRKCALRSSTSLLQILMAKRPIPDSSSRLRATRELTHQS